MGDDAVDQVRVPDEVVARVEVRDGDEAAVELQMRVEGRGDLLRVAGKRAVEDAILWAVERPLGIVAACFWRGARCCRRWDR